MAKKRRKNTFNQRRQFFLGIRLVEPRLPRQVEELLRRRSVAHEMEEEEVVQFIRADDLLGRLYALAAFSRGQQFGRNHRGDDVEQDALCLAGKLVARSPVHQELHQRFRDAAIGVVHAHVVGVVCGPAQRQFGQIARADHETAVHENVHAHPRLHVLKHQVLSTLGRQCAQSRGQLLDAQTRQIDAERAMTQDAHLFQTKLANVDLSGRNAKVLYQSTGIVARADRGAESRESKSMNPFARHAESIHRLARDH